MSYTGPERRMNNYCPGHDKLAEDISTVKTDIAVTKTLVANLDRRINGSMDSVARHIENGGKWRIAIFSAIVGLLITIGAGIFAYGVLVNKVDENRKDITTIAKAIEKVII